MAMMENNHKKINLFGILGIFVSFVITLTFNSLSGTGGNLSSIKQYYFVKVVTFFGLKKLTE
jgi:hypothetical protein